MNIIKYGIGLSLLVLMAACVKEKAPSGLVLHSDVNTKDTTYITTSVPAKQTKVIFFEEATGVHCSNCPDGAKLLKSLSDQNSGRILSAAIYSPFLNDFTSPSTHDFNQPEFLQLVNFLGGDPSKPSACIDRLPTNDVLPYFFDQTLWAGKVTQLLSKTTPVNIELSTQKVNNDYLLKSIFTFTDTLTAPLACTVYLLEDGIVDYQNDKNVDVLDYVHNHVLQKIITPLSGSAFLTDIIQKEKGRVFERSFLFSLPTQVVNKANCKLLCFVHKTGADKEILQVQEVDLE